MDLTAAYGNGTYGGSVLDVIHVRMYVSVTMSVFETYVKSM